MDSFVLLAYASLAASKILLQRLLACLSITLCPEDLYFWCKRKKGFLWTMAAAQTAENHGDEWGLTWYFQWGICINSNLKRQTKVTGSGRSTEIKGIFPWDVPQMITKIIPTSTKITLSYAMKREIPLWIWWEVNENWNNNMIRIPHWRENLCRTNTSVRRKK